VHDHQCEMSVTGIEAAVAIGGADPR